MKWGMSFTERMRFELAPGKAAINEAETSMPVVAVLPAAWYAKTGVYPGADAPSAEVDAGIIASPGPSFLSSTAGVGTMILCVAQL